ncbi:hypothetical protein MTR_4g122510 [Medicago truncatula]|uniref:Uncharacterized protein n=1 Tax=Medicago truncatula TaxID=3880 RepID=G7JNY5_MEDTR|nr:hypothetical protein MTR_4g122510 [Medicago truncatula]
MLLLVSLTIDIGAMVSKTQKINIVDYFVLHVPPIVWDLSLEDIGKLPTVNRTTKTQYIFGFIYNHTMALNTMRSHTGEAELIRSGVTRLQQPFSEKEKRLRGKGHML